MDPQKPASEAQISSPTADPSLSPCRKKKSESSTFMEDLRDHIDEFVHASMEEHKNCFKKTMQKMFGMSKAVAEKSSSNATEVESHLPLQTSVAK